MVIKEIFPFQPAQIAASGQCFRMTKLPSPHNSKAAFQVVSRDRKVTVTALEDNHFSFDCSQEEFENYWEDYFDLKTDYGEILSRIDPEDEYLGRASQAGEGIRILRQDLWETMVTFLISQNNNIPRIQKCVEGLCRRFGSPLDGCYGFPSPQTLADASLADLQGLSLGYRDKYIHAIAGRVASKELDLDALKTLPAKEAREILLACQGIGNKVADCICLFGLHHIDYFPIDTHIRSILASHYPEGFPFSRYQGVAGVIQQYLFYYDLHFKKQ